MSSDGGPDSSLDLAAMIEQLGQEFPFEVELSLGPLIRFWDEVIASED
ncbi:MAG: hypothetical protein HYY95_25070, partial [Candidatus Rokubacteria bacterium]|nr:hypothetical protein [Candidatus Rokubacteria bacterium]